MQGSSISDKSIAEHVEDYPKPSVLYEQHLKLTNKSRMAPFAGYLMPLWYSSISEEHHAVRHSAGIFDCTHMGILKVSGTDAAAFLNAVTTNNVDTLKIGCAHYSYVLDSFGSVLDDIIIYRKAQDDFMVVVNAANEPKIKKHFDALLNDKIVIDQNEADKRLPYKPQIRDMRDVNSSDDCRVDIALQGPNSLKILKKLTNKEFFEQLNALNSFQFAQGELDGIDCLISKTGYTGAKIGFELFVHPKNGTKLWQLLLEAGESFSLLPCGLGSRDSLRIEAGLPLYGHELAGEFNINPYEAGYGWAVKPQKEFFIGKKPMLLASNQCRMKVARIELPGAKGIRPVRQNDAVLDANGHCVGWVLSCAKIEEKQIALVYIGKETARENTQIGIYYLARNQHQLDSGRKQKVQQNEIIQSDLTGIVVSRFQKF